MGGDGGTGACAGRRDHCAAFRLPVLRRRVSGVGGAVAGDRYPAERDTDETWMRRAVDLAEGGRGTTSPNPMVGAVLVRDGRVVGEGFHQAAGQPHAEAVALAAAGAAAAGATCYVTLEPCAHHSRTPPCADALIAAGVARVVAALVDPDPRVDGAGLERLRAAGVEVVAGVGAEAAAEQNAAYLTHRRLGRPRVTL